MSFEINRESLQSRAREKGSKTVLAETVPDIVNSFKLSIWNLIDHLKDKDSYTLVDFI